MANVRIAPSLVPLLFLLAAGSCGGDASADGPGAGTPEADAAVTPVARAPLTEADLAGLSLAELSVEVPWTNNRVSHEPRPAAARSGVLEVVTASHETFDRVLFRFTDTAPFPGYSVEIVDATAPLACGGEERPLDLGGDRALVIHLAPARREGAGLDGVGETRAVGGARVTRAGTLCVDDNEMVWAAGLTSGDQVRLLELSGPQRLAVDVR